MTMSLAARLVVALTIAITGLCVYLVARPRLPRRLFLMDLGRDLTRADRARASRVLAINVLSVAAGVAGALAAGEETIAVLAILCPLVPVIALVVEATAAARTIDAAAAPAVSIEILESPPKAWEYVSAPLQAIHVAAIAAGTAVFTWLLGRLPEKVPVHWNLAGEPDRWSSPAEHWVLLGVLIFDTLLMWGIIAMVARERWALPAEDRERFVELQLRRRSLIVRQLEWIIVGIDLAFVAMWMLLAASGFPGRQDLATVGVVAPLILMGLATIVPLAHYLPQQLKNAEAIRQLAGTEVLGTREDGWVWGGLFYYAPEDPAVFVPKRLGIGQTLNMARPAAWIFLAAVVGVPLVLTVVLIAVGG